ncbi:GTP pyrophosphokinase family protein [Ornithinimicrobium sp. Arc0846-15]|nr:GTP pyrophosphokinase family protein [Ornithinimicrobium laminariae]
MSYKFGIDEIMTKVNVLKEEFQYAHDYSPIEHVSSRLKSPSAIVKKARNIGAPITIAGIRANIFDIAGIRITCSFVSDTYSMRDMLIAQPDVEIVVEKDYIASPKSNGYRSLHLICRVPVFMSDHVEYVYVEVQIRTVAMDFWASLEHKIYYKFQHDVPSRLLDELKEAADTAHRLDLSMEAMHDEVLALEASAGPESAQEQRDEEVAYIAQLFRSGAAKS